ncbi:MAG: DegT/DnrJ/EryC1/StrS family aminotransferase [Candidatus Omnitrophota bacterium]
MIKLSVPQITSSEKKAVLEVLKSGHIACGPKTKDFEEKFSCFIGTQYAVAASSGTSALHTALACSGIKENDSVITTPFTFIATANSILFCKATPVFCDIDQKTFNIDPDEIKKALNKNPSVKAIICVHLFGLPCDMDAIKSICRQKGLLLIEDCAQAHGAEYKNKRAGSFGDCGVFSLYATKNITTAEGGMITTNTKSIADRCRRFINHGRIANNKFSELGYNYRLTDIASAMGIEQLKKIPLLTEKRIENANYLTNRLLKLKHITPPATPAGYKHVFHQYVVRVKKDREKLIQFLSNSGIQSGVFYPIPIYRQQFYKNSGFAKLRLKNTETACRQVLSLPVHPGLKKDDLKKIAGALEKWKK